MKFKFLFCLLAIQSVLMAQRNSAIKEVSGAEYIIEKQDKPSYFQNAIKIGDNFFVIAKKTDKAYYNFFGYASLPHHDFKIFKLDAKMNVKLVASIPAEFANKDVQALKIEKFNNQLCALFYFNNKQQKKQFLFAQMYDAKNCNPVGKPYKIAETMITQKERKIGCIFKVNFSDDASKMLVTADRSNITRSRREIRAASAQKTHTFSYWLINNEFKLINSGKNISFGKGNTEVLDQVFDNDGNMCILGFEEGNKNTKSKFKVEDLDELENNSNSQLIMKIIRPSGEAVTITFAEGEYFYSAMMKYNVNTGNVAVIGLLGSGGYGAKGIFTQQVNIKSAEVLTENKTLFGTNLVAEINSVKDDTKKQSSSKSKQKESKRVTKKSIPDYIYTYVRLGECFYNDSNELIVVGQKYSTYVEVYTTTDSKGRTTTRYVYHYVYGDIISFKLDAEGSIENFGIVFHYLDTTVPVYKDFTALYSGEKLYIMTRSSGGQIAFNNSFSKLQSYKEYGFSTKKRYYADFMNVSDNEMMHISSKKKRLIFSLISVKLD
ncbi:MAG: hypothetical protein RLZZ318_1062 [Bacteroidota bacterium]